MKEDMLKSIIKLQVAAETLARQKIINKDVYDYIYREIKFLSERIEKIEDKKLITFNPHPVITTEWGFFLK